MFANSMTRTFVITVCLAVIPQLQPQAQALNITTLNNTGTSGGVALVGTGVADPNYSFIVTQSNPFPVTVDDTTWPIFGGPWFPNNSGSRWIGPDGSSYGPAGSYTYRTNFYLPPTTDLSTVNVSGLWATDDWYVDILINGYATGAVNAGFTTLSPFSITSNFTLGNNTIDFELINAGGPTGLRVDQIKGSYRLVPEPGTLSLATLALTSTAMVLRRRHRAHLS
jgi:hypothetical protein